ncbi:uncharacterized protein LOC132715613 [Ruditapes philippinarum]|uniref:uncharacterized protein LOC132715613 n=1 Tax=Ruditapes philippinarum TaxID=129788 RepID=UPI00295BBE2C|nr:uncharacterized protein LOC132715613 [Ruditapes philippinarum]
MLKFRRSVGKVDNSGSEGNNNDVVNNNNCSPAPSLDNRKLAMDNKNSRFGFNMNKAVNEFSMSQKIYTDWANHYLEKARSKRYISDLQQDVTDGVLLADVIEAVTNEKLQDIKTKPKNSAQMVSHDFYFYKGNNSY